MDTGLKIIYDANYNQYAHEYQVDGKSRQDFDQRNNTYPKSSFPDQEAVFQQRTNGRRNRLADKQPGDDSTDKP